jgi:TolB protein
VEAARTGREGEGQASLTGCHNAWMRALTALVLATASLVAIGAAQSSAATHMHNGAIAYVHLSATGVRDQIYSRTVFGTDRRQLTRSPKFSSFAPSYSPNGTRLVFVRAYKQADIWTMNANGSRLGRLTWTKRIWETTPGWSPGGRQIVFSVASPAALQGIWVVDSNGRHRRRLTTGADSRPAWSPDGKQIVFQRYDESSQTFGTLVVPAAGGAATELTSDPGHSDFQPAWSPTGSRILFVSDRGDNPQGADQLDLWMMKANGSGVRRVTNTPTDERDPSWSPDGSRIVYSGEGSIHGAASSQIYVSDANGSHRHALTQACGDCAIINEEPSWQALR